MSNLPFPTFACAPREARAGSEQGLADKTEQRVNWGVFAILQLWSGYQNKNETDKREELIGQAGESDRRSQAEVGPFSNQLRGVTQHQNVQLETSGESLFPTATIFS